MRQIATHTIALVVAVAAVAVAWAHETIEVGQDGTPQHKIKLHGDPNLYGGISINPLDPETGTGPLDGFYIHEGPELRSLGMDHPDEGVFELLAGHSMLIQRVSFDPGLMAVTTSTFEPVLETDGATTDTFPSVFGDFSRLLLFVTAPDTAPGAEFFGEFRLIDPSGLHADSDVFRLRFVALPEPAAGLMAVLAGVILTRRRG